MLQEIAAGADEGFQDTLLMSFLVIALKVRTKILG